MGNRVYPFVSAVAAEGLTAIGIGPGGNLEADLRCGTSGLSGGRHREGQRQQRVTQIGHCSLPC